MGIPLISIKNLSYTYATRVPILENVGLEISSGDYLGIIGPNGSGKTTFLKLLLGLLPLQKGSVEIFGEPIATFHNWKKIGYVPQTVFQNDASFPATVEEIVESGYHLQESPFIHFGIKNCRPLAEVVETAGIGHLMKRRIGELSGGERQRVFIARALISEPTLLILDEPTAGIDLTGEKAFYALLKTLNQKHGITIILVSHDLEALAHNAKTALCLNRQVVYLGPAEGLHEKRVVEAVFGRQAWHSYQKNYGN